MRPRYIFSSRKTRGARASAKMRKQREKYPSISDKIISQADILLEILDARFPDKTQNNEVEEKIKSSNKKVIYVLNKADLTKENKFKLKPNVFVSCKTRKGIRKLRDLIKITSKKINKDDKIIVGVLGYPNVGKSSLINLLVGKSSAPVGSDAGFTKGVQKLKLSENIFLIDTPGVIPQKEYSSSETKKITKHTIVGGRSYSQVKEPEMVIAQLMKDYPQLLEKHYQIDAKENSEVLLEELGKKLNYFKKKGKVDFDKTARKILKDWQEGVIKI